MKELTSTADPSSTTKTRGLVLEPSIAGPLHQRWNLAFRWGACLLLLTLLRANPSTVFAEADHGGGKGQLETMTVNLYLGAGTERILALDPTDPGYITNLLEAVTGVYYEILASQPQLRLRGVAKEVAERKPDILAVEEASLIRKQSPGDLVFGGTNPATNVVFDYLQLLVQALAARGAHYTVVSTADEIDVELPMVNLQASTFDDVRLTDREAILVRTELLHHDVRIQNPRSGNYNSAIHIPSLGLSVLRGWCSVDVAMHGETFRYICTHLEEETAPQIQLLQAEELLSGPAAVPMPVVIVGDFNADSMGRNGTVTYDTLIGAGFSDAWAARHPHHLAGGLTWGHDEFLADPNVPLVWRIDLVLYRGGNLVPTDADVLDINLHRRQPPLWASDHAAVDAQFHFREGRNGRHATEGHDD